MQDFKVIFPRPAGDFGFHTASNCGRKQYWQSYSPQRKNYVI